MPGTQTRLGRRIEFPEGLYLSSGGKTLLTHLVKVMPAYIFDASYHHNFSIRPNRDEGIVIPITSTGTISLTGAIRELNGFITDRFRISNEPYSGRSFNFTLLGEIDESHRSYTDSISALYDRTEAAIGSYFSEGRRN